MEFILLLEILQNKKKVQASIFNYVVYFWNREAASLLNARLSPLQTCSSLGHLGFRPLHLGPTQPLRGGRDVGLGRARERGGGFHVYT